jgi:hypothetical protein
MVPWHLDEVWLSFCHPTDWNVNVVARVIATILNHQDEGHSWGWERVNWKEPGSLRPG